MRPLLVVFAVTLAVLVSADWEFEVEHQYISKCPEDENGNLSEEFQVMSSRPLCSYECHDYLDGVDDLEKELDRAVDCHRDTVEFSLACYRDPDHSRRCDDLDPDDFQPKKQADVEEELESTWGKSYRRVFYQYSCKTYVGGEKKICASSKAVMEIINGIASACAKRDPSELESVVMSENVLSCDSPHTLPISSNQYDPDVLDEVEDPPPVDNPDTCPAECTKKEKQDLYEYYNDLIADLQEISDEMFADHNAMGVLSLEIFQRATAYTNFRPDWMRKFDALMERRRTTKERGDEAKARLQEVEEDLANLVSINPWLEPSGSRLQTVPRRLRSSERQSKSIHRCLDREVCVGHIWKKSIWLHNQCRSVCVSYLCTDRLTFRYCFQKTMQWGMTMKRCHANQYTRRKCFIFD
ncbi:hypothetical protein NDN08_003354 [Rhodosorus marinus]|uniref:Uncharacterized protein n=1 Tax=Rhodosorus marinus TaxID=101924 RepID=A0AAV8UW95_9RHOD|nr:hypothetical protein NDN08_003354 [Rhodosorus marinus]